MGDYVAIKIPRELAKEMDKLIGKYGFRSRAEIAKEGIRRILFDRLTLVSSLSEEVLEQEVVAK